MNLDNIIKLAVDAHLGQRDKANLPYILHPLRLMMKFELYEEMATAILHDVIEDTSVTSEELEKQGISKEILDAVNCLTKKDGEDYQDFIQRISQNSLATKVKIEDIKDNLDLLRLKTLTDDDLLRAKKYHQAVNQLRGK
jgi:(p)ppGpp synthase/HD superfamily hydrolase